MPTDLRRPPITVRDALEHLLPYVTDKHSPGELSDRLEEHGIKTIQHVFEDPAMTMDILIPLLGEERKARFLVDLILLMPGFYYTRIQAEKDFERLEKAVKQLEAQVRSIVDKIGDLALMRTRMPIKTTTQILLDETAKSSEGVSASELAQKLGLSRAYVSGLLNQLVEAGKLMKIEKGRKTYFKTVEKNL
ncbi:MAG: hypothetical protein DRO11_04710 [Methanobacteriota archaeon]|nr:MAG: hypothetical protein DRO11_04710 [Euryarchaeota archaeon]